MTVNEFALRLRAALDEELDTITEEQNKKGRISSFDQGRSFEIGVCEGLIIKILKEGENK